MKIKTILSLGLAAVLSMAPIADASSRDSRMNFAEVNPDNKKFVEVLVGMCVKKIVEENSDYSIEDFIKMDAEKQNAILKDMYRKDVFRRVDWLKKLQELTGESFEYPYDIHFNFDFTPRGRHLWKIIGKKNCLEYTPDSYPMGVGVPLRSFLDGFSVGLFPNLKGLSISFGCIDDLDDRFNLLKSFDTAVNSDYFKRIKSLNILFQNRIMYESLIRGIENDKFSSIENLCVDARYDRADLSRLTNLIALGKTPKLSSLNVVCKDEGEKIEQIVRNGLVGSSKESLNVKAIVTRK